MDVIMFMLTDFVAGLSFSMIFFKYNLFKERLGVSNSKISLAFSMGSLSNIIIFPFTSRMIKFVGGPIRMIVSGLFIYFARYVMMSYTDTYWIMLLLQGASCITFATMWASFMEYANEISPSNIKTTVIVLVQSVHFGLGCFFGNTVGGFLYGMYDATTLFRWNGVMCAIWACVLTLYHGVGHLKTKREASSSHKNDDDLMMAGKLNDIEARGVT